MHIILSKLVWGEGEMVVAIARHLPAGTFWTDDVAGNGETAVSIVPGEIPEEAIDAIKADRDVLDYLFIGNANDPLGEIEMAKVTASAARHGIPMDSMPETPNGSDVAAAIKRRMLLSQIAADQAFETAERIERGTIERLKAEGFDTEELDSGDDPKTRMNKAQKRRG
jgi:hypothetical protein